jgi:hypothetical protein
MLENKNINKSKTIVDSKSQLEICKKYMSYERFAADFELSFKLSKQLIAEAAVSKIILN